MNKTEMISKVAESVGFTKKDVTVVTDAIFDAIKTSVAEGEDVKISGFGAFKPVEVAERTGTIQLGDRKGEAYVTPAHNKVTFKVATAFKEAVK